MRASFQNAAPQIMSDIGALRAEKRTSSFSAIMAALSSVVSGGHEAVAETMTSSLPHHRLEEKVNVERLDVCHLGHHR